MSVAACRGNETVAGDCAATDEDAAARAAADAVPVAGRDNRAREVDYPRHFKNRRAAAVGAFTGPCARTVFCRRPHRPVGVLVGVCAIAGVVSRGAGVHWIAAHPADAVLLGVALCGDVHCAAGIDRERAKAPNVELLRLGVVRTSMGEDAARADAHVVGDDIGGCPVFVESVELHHAVGLDVDRLADDDW